MPRVPQNLKVFDPDDADCLRLIETLADGNPIPDTSTICQNRQRLIALLAEISKGERSELFSNIRVVAERRGLSAQEIGSRAAFLLACLDTPGADDPYAILGVAPTSTTEEIKEAWLSRLSLYHPDRHPDNGDWFTRQAARLNEAYHTLKDPARRHAADERRRRGLLALQHSSPLVTQAVSTAAPSSSSPPLRLARYQAPILITAASLAATGLVLLTLFSRPQAGSQLYLETVQPAAAVTHPPRTPIAGQPPARPVQGRSASLDASITPLLAHQPEQIPIARTQRVSLPTGVSSGQLDSSDLPVRGTQTGDPAVSKRAATDPILLAQALPPIVLEPKGLDRQEIDALLDEYVDAYEKGEVDRLMTTLSQKVREKGTLDYQAIRNAYMRGFTGRDQIIYRLKNVQVDIKGEQATVTAQYLISARNAAQSAKGTTVSGRIEWKIQREGEKLRIVSINY